MKVGQAAIERLRISVISDYQLDGLQDGLVVGRNAWGYWRLPTHSYDVLSLAQKEGLLARGERLFYGLKGAVGHLLIVSRAYPVNTWAADLRAHAMQPAPGWGHYLNDTTSYLAGQSLQEREVYLGLRISERVQGLFERFVGKAEQPLGLRDPRINPAELHELQMELERYGDRISDPHARPATEAELRWLLHHMHWRGTQRDVEATEFPRRPAWGGELLSLVDCDLRVKPYTIRLGTEPDVVYTTGLCFRHIPMSLSFPGRAEWLAGVSTLPFPVEVSCRFQVLTPAEAADMALRQAKVATDQADHDAEVGATSGPDVAEAMRSAMNVQARVMRDQQPLVRAWPRLYVAAASERELTRRVEAVRARMADFGIEIEQPPHQAHLFTEALPGDQVRLDVYEQLMEPATLAATMPAASSHLGDRSGSYQGFTLGTTRSLVMLDPVGAGEQDRPTGISITGQPGGGKSALATKLGHDAALAGADVTVIDPTQQMTGLARMDPRGDGKWFGNRQLVRLGPEHAGLLDPFRIIHERPQAALVAADIARAMLPPDLAQGVESRLLTSAAAEAEQAERPSMAGVLRRLADVDTEITRHASDLLRTCSNLPLARTCFGQAQAAEGLRLQGALTVIQFSDVTLPPEGKVRNDFSIEERLAVGLMRALTALIDQLIDTSDPDRRKLLIFDEFWTVGSSLAGHRLAERVGRMGRKRNTHLALVTQNARDLLDETITNCLGIRVQFRSDDAREIDAALSLFDVAPTPEVIGKIRSLLAGQCLVRDLEHRVGFMQVDLFTQYLREATDTTPGGRARFEEEVA